jgi:hypothetical protein
VVDIALLALLGPSCEQDNEPLSVLAEIQAVSLSEIDPPLGNALADRFDVSKIAGFDAGNRRADLCCGPGIQSIEPCLSG